MIEDKYYIEFIGRDRLIADKYELCSNAITFSFKNRDSIMPIVYLSDVVADKNELLKLLRKSEYLVITDWTGRRIKMCYRDKILYDRHIRKYIGKFDIDLKARISEIQIQQESENAQDTQPTLPEITFDEMMRDA